MKLLSESFKIFNRQICITLLPLKSTLFIFSAHCCTLNFLIHDAKLKIVFCIHCLSSSPPHPILLFHNLFWARISHSKRARCFRVLTKCTHTQSLCDVIRCNITTRHTKRLIAALVTRFDSAGDWKWEVSEGLSG